MHCLIPFNISNTSDVQIKNVSLIVTGLIYI